MRPKTQLTADESPSNWPPLATGRRSPRRPVPNSVPDDAAPAAFGPVRPHVARSIHARTKAPILIVEDETAAACSAGPPVRRAWRIGICFPACVAAEPPVGYLLVDGHLPGYRRRGFHRFAHCDALVERGDRVRVLDNLSTGHRKNLAAFGRPSRIRRRRPGRSRRGRTGARWRRSRVPPGGAGLGAAERRGAARHECRVRHRHGQAARRGPPAAACGASSSRGSQQRVRRPADAGQARRPAALPRLALRRRQAGRRILLPGVHRHLRPGNGDASATSTSSARGRIRRANTRP